MGIGEYYYDILGIPQSSTTEEVKKAYHALVRRTHPDLFPEDKKRLQELKMVQINEAYTRIVRDTIERPPNGGAGEDAIRVQPRGRHDVGFCRDIEYAYYKQGFSNYSKALHGIEGIERKAALRTDWYYLRRFSGSLGYLRKADVYFTRLIDEFPDSIWANDSWVKVKRIEYFSRLYQRILKNMEDRMRKQTPIRV